jgi:hypothetical protein
MILYGLYGDSELNMFINCLEADRTRGKLGWQFKQIYFSNEGSGVSRSFLPFTVELGWKGSGSEVVE